LISYESEIKLDMRSYKAAFPGRNFADKFQQYPAVVQKTALAATVVSKLMKLATITTCSRATGSLCSIRTGDSVNSE